MMTRWFEQLQPLCRLRHQQKKEDQDFRDLLQEKYRMMMKNQLNQEPLQEDLWEPDRLKIQDVDRLLDLNQT